MTYYKDGKSYPVITIDGIKEMVYHSGVMWLPTGFPFGEVYGNIVYEIIDEE